jgi:hypothetical protein
MSLLSELRFDLFLQVYKQVAPNGALNSPRRDSHVEGQALRAHD